MGKSAVHETIEEISSRTAADMARIVIAEFAWENQPECTRQVLAGSACAESSGITRNISSSCPEVRAVGSRRSAALTSGQELEMFQVIPLDSAQAEPAST